VGRQNHHSNKLVLEVAYNQDKKDRDAVVGHFTNWLNILNSLAHNLFYQTINFKGL
jgi:hypothetical protein